MTYNYYIDESGNSGDLIGKNIDLSFGGQPIFTLACVGISNEEELVTQVNKLKEKHGVKDKELKSSDLYFAKPEFILDVAKLISDLRLPILVELVDKRYCIATSIVLHQIWPRHFTEDGPNEEAQHIRNGWADYMAHNLKNTCYEKFFEACKNPSEKNLLSSMHELISFFREKNNIFHPTENIVECIQKTINEYRTSKKREGETEAVKYFIPIPDVKKNNKYVYLSPHVHSLFNLIQRLNKYHPKELGNVTLHHDKQEDFDEILVYSKELMEKILQKSREKSIFDSGCNVTHKLNLEFVDSERSVGVQIADLVAGYFSRYINGVSYKEIIMKEIYHDIFMCFPRNYYPSSPLGINYVIPESKYEIILKTKRDTHSRKRQMSPQ